LCSIAPSIENPTLPITIAAPTSDEDYMAVGNEMHALCSVAQRENICLSFSAGDISCCEWSDAECSVSLDFLA